MSWKSPCRPSRKNCHRNTALANFTKLLNCLCLWLPTAVTSSICSSNSDISKCSSSSRRQQTRSFQSRQHTTLETIRNGGCLGRNSIILSFSNTFQQNWGKLYILLFSICIEFHAKTSRITEMLTKVTARGRILLCSFKKCWTERQ